jgi:cytochrome c553
MSKINIFQGKNKGYIMGKKLSIVATACTALSLITSPVFATGDSATGQSKSTACAACHMPDGNSVVSLFPKIAGQSSSYIINQLQAFKANRRVDPSMNPQVAQLTEQDMADLAAYFSSQTVKPTDGQKSVAGVGQDIYLKGNIKNGVIACVGCHGQKGEGNQAALEKTLINPLVIEAPAVGAQHSVYVAKQLKAFKTGERGNDVGKIMRNIAKGMNDDEIQAVSEYIAGLDASK